MRHRVNKKTRVVCLWHTALKSWSVFKITTSGKISKKAGFNSEGLTTSFEPDWSKAMSALGVRQAGFEVLLKSDTDKIEATTWDELAIKIWNLANTET